MNYAIVGLGYIAEKHLKAIKMTKGNLLYAYDPYHITGILDKYFLNCIFTQRHEAFETYLSNSKIDYLVICSPSNTHFEYINLAHEYNITPICEKPMVVRLRDLDEINTDRTIYNILQLRYSKYLKDIASYPVDYTTDGVVNVKYHTPRGNWYYRSWKNDQRKSGGLIMNIGVHLFDLMLFLFGPGKPTDIKLDYEDFTDARGSFRINSTIVNWDLSIDKHKERVREINGQKLWDADNPIGLEDLHLQSYKQILKGNGIVFQDVKPVLSLVEEYQNLPI